MRVALLLVLAGCTPAAPVDEGPGTSGDSASPPAACSGDPGVTWDSFAHGFFLNYCQACHASANTVERFGAPTTDFFDTEAAVLARAARVRGRVIDEQTMPVGGGVNPDDLTLLDVYLRCVTGN